MSHMTVVNKLEIYSSKMKAKMKRNKFEHRGGKYLTVTDTIELGYL